MFASCLETANIYHPSLNPVGNLQSWQQEGPAQSKFLQVPFLWQFTFELKTKFLKQGAIPCCREGKDRLGILSFTLGRKNPKKAVSKRGLKIWILNSIADREIWFRTAKPAQTHPMPLIPTPGCGQCWSALLGCVRENPGNEEMGGIWPFSRKFCRKTHSPMCLYFQRNKHSPKVL